MHLKGNEFSLRKAIHHFLERRKRLSKMTLEKRKEFYYGFCFLHGIEILVILFLLGIFISEYFFMVFLGITFHLFLDLLEEIHKGLRLDKLSVIYDWFKFKKLKYLG